jgi:hypothetical protein
MSVLKPIKDGDTVQINVKIPVELRDQANNIKDKLKSKGFTIDLNEAAVSGIKRLIKTAEKELKGLDAKGDTASATKTPAKTSTKQDSKSTTPSAAART